MKLSNVLSIAKRGAELAFPGLAAGVPAFVLASPHVGSVSMVYLPALFWTIVFILCLGVAAAALEAYLTDRIFGGTKPAAQEAAAC